METLVLAPLALFVESLIGYPKRLYGLAGHPVEWAGRAISYLDLKLNQENDPPDRRRLMGLLAVAALSLGSIGLGLTIQVMLMAVPFGWVVNVLLATTLIAQSSMRDHVQAVADALARSLPDARIAVAQIVGRDTSALDHSGVSKACLESLAENTSDGIVAPALWYAAAGLPGILFYKVINTADSMIGHKSDRHLQFGWAAARLDDLLNLPASRLCGVLFAAAAWFSSREAALSALRSMWRDATKHQSPNAGWPEAAMAGALGLRFGGPRTYEGETVDLAWMGHGRTEMDHTDIAKGLSLFERSNIILAMALFALAVVL